MDNIEYFNRLTLAVFKRLYESFPTPIELDIQKLSEEAVPLEGSEADGFDQFVAAPFTVEFLRREGFLTFDTLMVTETVFVQTCLTMRGLAVLNSTPAVLSGKEPLIVQIKGALAKGAKEASADAVKQLMQHILSAAVALAPTVIAGLGGS